MRGGGGGCAGWQGPVAGLRGPCSLSEPPVLEEEGKEKPSLSVFRNRLADCPRDAQAFLTGACWETWPLGRKHLATDKKPWAETPGSWWMPVGRQGPPRVLMRFKGHLHFKDKCKLLCKGVMTVSLLSEVLGRGGLHH